MSALSQPAKQLKMPFAGSTIRKEREDFLSS
jgi:hypothetical protein